MVGVCYRSTCSRRLPPPPREKRRTLGQGARPLLHHVLRPRRLRSLAARLWLGLPAGPHSPVTLRAPATWGASSERAERSGRLQHIIVMAVEGLVCSSGRPPPPLEMGRALGRGTRPHHGQWQQEMGTRPSSTCQTTCPRDRAPWRSRRWAPPRPSPLSRAVIETYRVECRATVTSQAGRARRV
jgi:hypothetical protein